MRSAGLVARIGERSIYSLEGKLRKRDHLEDHSVERRIILKWGLKMD
jgi:hypothetical protein